MGTLLHDLYNHQAWADAEHWRALGSIPGALDDQAVRGRLHHIHLVQQAFLSIVRSEPVRPRRAEDFASIAELRDYACANHAAARQYLQTVRPDRLAEFITIPWFRNPPIHVTIEQALYQAAMHSQYHRGQNATRMRELGGVPPTTDLIFWYWKGKPDAIWI